MSIIIPNGGHVINDATAMPEDVVSGKVFYNNEGKVEGTLPLSEYTEVKSVNIPVTADTSKSNTVDYRIRYLINQYGILTSENWSDTISFWYTSVTSIDYDVILSIQVRSTVLPLSINRKCGSLFSYEETHTDSSYRIIVDLGIYIQSGKIYTYTNLSTAPTIICNYI